MWLTDEFPKTCTLEITIEALGQYGVTGAFIKECERLWPGYIYAPKLRSMELRLLDKRTVERVAIYRLPDVAKTLFHHNYRPKAVTLYLERLKIA